MVVAPILVARGRYVPGGEGRGIRNYRNELGSRSTLTVSRLAWGSYQRASAARRWAAWGPAYQMPIQVEQCHITWVEPRIGWRNGPKFVRMVPNSLPGARRARHGEGETDHAAARAAHRLVALVLLASLACGSVLVGWHAANSVRTELRAALDVGVNTSGTGSMMAARTIALESCADWSPRSTAIATCAQRCWMRKGGRSRRPSCSLRLSRCRTGSLADRRPALSVACRFLQQWRRHHPADRSDQRDRRSLEESRDAVLVLAGFAALSALLISTVVGRALRSLEICRPPSSISARKLPGRCRHMVRRNSSAWQTASIS